MDSLEVHQWRLAEISVPEFLPQIPAIRVLMLSGSHRYRQHHPQKPRAECEHPPASPELESLSDCDPSCRSVRHNRPFEHSESPDGLNLASLSIRRRWSLLFCRSQGMCGILGLVAPFGQRIPERDA